MAIISKKFCPNCGSNDVQMVAGGTTGMFMCGDCGYSGSVFPERPIIGSERVSDGKMSESVKNVRVAKEKGKKKRVKINLGGRNE